VEIYWNIGFKIITKFKNVYDMGLLVRVYYMNIPSKHKMANNDNILYIHFICNMDNRYNVGTPATYQYTFLNYY